MTSSRPSFGFTANCTFEPPVSTPILRSTAIDALRMRWYSLSVSVCAGATVIESPVCTPIGIEVLDGADDDAVVVLVANDFHLEFFPADHRFFDEHFGSRRCIEAALDDLFELLAVVGDAAARATHGERRTDDAGKADSSPGSRAPAPAYAPRRRAGIRGRSRAWRCGTARGPRPCRWPRARRRSARRRACASTPSRTRSSAVLSAVWPPMVGSSASGSSFSMMRASVRQLMGSM